MNEPRLTHLIMYLRKSRADNDDEPVEVTLQKHEQILQRYALEHYGGEIPQTKIYREVVSGETIEARPVMLFIIDMIQNGDVDGVLVVDPQRLSRGDLADTGLLSRLFNYTNTLVITPNHSYNISDKYDRKFFEMELMRGNDYLEYTKEILNRGRVAAVKSGHYLGSVPPYGYDKVFVGKAPTLAINEDETRNVKIMFTKIAYEDCTISEVATYLNSIGTKPRHSSYWSYSNIRDVVQNPVYIGKIQWNRRKTQKKFDNGSILMTRPRNEETILCDGIHPAIIEEDVFYAVQRILADRNKVTRINRMPGKAPVNPYAGLLHCRCGFTMSAKVYYKPRKGRDTIVPPAVYCPHQKHCHCKGTYLYRVTETLISSLEVNVSECEAQIEELKKGNSYKSSEMEAINKEKAEIKKQREKLYDLLEKEIYTAELFKERNAKLNDRLAEIEITEKEILKSSKTIEHIEEMKARLLECIKILNTPTADPVTINKLLKTTISDIIYSRDRSHDQSPITLRVILKD